MTMMCENKSTSTPTLETKDWHLLPLPTSSIAEEEQEHIKVGLVQIHPNNTKLVYTTRSRSDQSRDVAKELIIVQDISSNHNDASSSNNLIICSFTLRELIKQLNHFLQEEHQSSLSELTTAEDMMILQGGHIEAVSSLTAPLIGAHLLGAVQDISFLDRNALRCVLPPGLVGDDDDDDERERLLIGFRRCMVVVSIVGLGLRHDDNNSNKMTIEAYIGPHNVDEYENDTKIQKRQPSSFAIPISEHILAYGCYDGGIRFYDIYKRQQAKACLGPNGRSNPIVKMINANSTTKCNSQQQHQQTQLRPRIISACVSANAYLWELNLSIDLPTHEINHFDIPPPIATFDGLVAAVSASGVPVTYPPPLSPTTRAALSPCCSWDQTDLLQEQFRISYDGHGDRLCFAFSPDAIGTSLNPYGTRQERLELNGALVFWNLADLPLLNTSWPLPPIAPLCVSSLPRTKNGRVTSDFVLPGYHCCCGNEDASSFLITLYATTANEVAAALTSLENGSDCVQKGVNAAFLSDLSMLQLDDSSESGFECHSLTFSSSDPTIVAIGTEKGTLLVRVTEDLNATSSSFATSSSSSDCNDTPEKKSIVLDENYRINDDRAINECREQDESNDAEEQLPLANEADDTDNLCQSPMDEESSQGSPAPAALESPSATSDTNVLKEELRLTLERLERQEEKNKELSTKLAAAEKKAEAIFRSSGLDQSSNQWGDSMKEPRALLEGADDAKKDEVEEQPSRGRRLTVEEADAAISRRLSLSDALSLEESEVTSYNDADDDVSELTGDHIQTMQEENADLRRQVHELIANKDEVSDVSNDGDLFQQLEREKLHQQLSIAKENEQSLREYIELLEQNKDAVEEDLEYARRDAEKNAAMVENLETDVYEQKLALEEMANLLEEERQMRDEVIASMKNEPQSERTDTDEMLYLKEENAQLKEEVALHVAMTTAMKVELQNALNELAELRRQE